MRLRTVIRFVLLLLFPVSSPMLGIIERMVLVSSLLRAAAARLDREFEVSLFFVGYDALIVSVHSHYYFNLQAAPIIESNLRAGYLLKIIMRVQ